MTIETLKKMALIALSDNNCPKLSEIEDVCSKLCIAFPEVANYNSLRRFVIDIQPQEVHDSWFFQA